MHTRTATRSSSGKRFGFVIAALLATLTAVGAYHSAPANASYAVPLMALTSASVNDGVTGFVGAWQNLPAQSEVVWSKATARTSATTALPTLTPESNFTFDGARSGSDKKQMSLLVVIAVAVASAFCWLARREYRKGAKSLATASQYVCISPRILNFCGCEMR